MHLLLVEDDRKLARTLSRGLQAEGYGVDIALTGTAALEHAQETSYDVVILDVLLPGLNGYDTCRRLRERDRGVPVLMLTALGEITDRIEGLDAGADDYLLKPFAFDELLARLRALIRRGLAERPQRLSVGALEADPFHRLVRWHGAEIELTPREFELLTFMMRRPGVVLTREELLQHVWSGEQATSANVVDVYVGYLRRKLEREPDRPRLIRTVRGSGFTLEA